MISPDKLKPLADALIEKQETLAVAESVTAGLLMANLSLSENATLFLQGGIVCYNLGQKTRQLGIEPIHAEQVNCVSETIATQMAVNVAQRFCSKWGIAITGYAVPVPALKIKTCFAYCSITYDGSEVNNFYLETFKRGQFNVQQYFVSKVISLFIKQCEMHSFLAR